MIDYKSIISLVLLVLHSCSLTEPRNKGCNFKFLYPHDNEVVFIDWETIVENKLTLDTAKQLFDFNYCDQKYQPFQTVLPSEERLILYYIVPLGSCHEIVGKLNYLRVWNFQNRNFAYINSDSFQLDDSLFTRTIYNYFIDTTIEWSEKAIHLNLNNNIDNQNLKKVIYKIENIYAKYIKEKEIEVDFYSMDSYRFKIIIEKYPLRIGIEQKMNLEIPKNIDLFK